jgi:ribose-phosphate pyrophosphokinase
MNQNLMVVSGTANRDLAGAIARWLDVDLAKCWVERFPDSEVNVELGESVRERRVFIIQSSCPPVDQHAMEAFAIADACRRAAAGSITWVAPYFGYARGDKRRGKRRALMGRLIADFAEQAGINQLIAVDLHSPQVEGFFRAPVENLTAVPVIADALKENLLAESVIVSPDAGGIKLASAYGARLGCRVAVLHKERLDGAKTAITKIAGDVRGRACVIADDMISTGGTIKNAIEVLLQAGAGGGVTVAATHPVFTPEAQQNLNHPAIQQIVVTDSVPMSQHDWSRSRGVKVVSLAPLLASTIRRDVCATR